MNPRQRTPHRRSDIHRLAQVSMGGTGYEHGTHHNDRYPATGDCQSGEPPARCEQLLGVAEEQQLHDQPGRVGDRRAHHELRVVGAKDLERGIDDLRDRARTKCRCAHCGATDRLRAFTASTNRCASSGRKDSSSFRLFTFIPSNEMRGLPIQSNSIVPCS